jgi:hypothetical protein
MTVDVFIVLFWIFIIFVFFLGALFIGAIILGSIKRLKSEQKNIIQINQEPQTNWTEDELEKDSAEDSEGDGLMLFDDPLFPPEFDEDDDDQ